MSGRSATARKKITDTPNRNKRPERQSSRSRTRLDYPAARHDHPYNATYYDPNYPLPSSPGLVSTSGRSNESSHSEHDDFHSGIERSGLRSLMDKTSGDVRKGLAKTFTFKKKDKDDGGRASPIPRPGSVATVRQNSMRQDYDRFDEFQAGPSMAARPPGPHHYHSYHYPLHHQPYPLSPQDPPPEMSLPGPPPSTKLPPIPPNAGAPMKRFVGGGRPASRWNKLRKDPELWDPNGDVLVYLGHREQGDPPSLRLSSHVIESTKNRYLVTQLREGFIEDSGELQRPDSYCGQPTPPVSEADDLAGDISYEMHFPPAPGANRTETLRHQTTTRNVFAMIYGASVVGLSIHQALSDLHARLEKYHSPGESDPIGRMADYISTRALDDVRGDAELAVGLLAWAEQPGIYWTAGWREAFLHCAGMYGQKLERCADWKHVSPLTRALLERSWLEIRIRVGKAEERLAEFSFGDMWSGSFPGSSLPSSGSTPAPIGSARAAAERFRNFLISHYTHVYGSWPPSINNSSAGGEEEEEMWLTRAIVVTLQQDFGALYDYLVDREVVWDVSEARAGRKWMMASKDWDRAFQSDVPGMPMTDIVIEFDNRLRVPHIPHPHPLLPESIPPQASPGGGLFKSSQQPRRQAGRERWVALAYTESTNLDSLSSTYAPSSLVDAFTRFEKSDCVGDVDPQMARRGRWVLLYGILQVLAGVSVDAPGVRYSDEVGYHLSAKAKKPSWSRESSLFVDATRELSHCWIVPQTWTNEEDAEEPLDTVSRKLSGMTMSPRFSVWTSPDTNAYPSGNSSNRESKVMDLPLRRREHHRSDPSGDSLASFLELDSQRKKGVMSDVYDQSAPLSRGPSPLIRDFDEEP